MPTLQIQFNISLGADALPQNAASRRLLRAGQLRR